MVIAKGFNHKYGFFKLLFCESLIHRYKQIELKCQYRKIYEVLSYQTKFFIL